MEAFNPLLIVYTMVPMILSLTVHEYAHAWTAMKLGDDTAARMGRLTLNPIAHIDPIGTLLIPLVGLITHAPLFGWAKPVPIQPLQFTRRFRMKTGVLFTSAAGPLSNLLFATLLAGLIGLLAQIKSPGELLYLLQQGRGVWAALLKLGLFTIAVNVGLFVFNLLPLPPLDGSGVLAGFLPDRFVPILDSLSRYSFLLLIAILYFAGEVIWFPVYWIVAGLSTMVGFPIWEAFYYMLQS